MLRRFGWAATARPPVTATAVDLSPYATRYGFRSSKQRRKGALLLDTARPLHKPHLVRVLLQHFGEGKFDINNDFCVCTERCTLYAR